MRSVRPRPLLPIEFGDARHQGKWIVLVNNTVVDSDKDLCACLTRVRSKHPGEEPMVLKLALPDRLSGGHAHHHHHL